MGFKAASNLTKGHLPKTCKDESNKEKMQNFPLVNFQHKGQNAVKGIKEDFVQYGPQMFQY